MIINKIQVKNIINKSDLPACEYSVNPYTGCGHACKYCYACFMKRFTGHNENWGEFVDIKYWDVIKNPKKYSGKEIFIGSVTDPYQPCEEEYKRTRTLLEELKDSDVKISLSTKSNLILRDLELIKSFKDVRISWSINTLDENFKNDMDNAVSIERRINAMKIFHDAGIRTTCFISPIFPGITNVKAIIEKVKDCCNLIWLENLNLRGTFKPVILNYIKKNYPDLVPLYNDIYTHNNNFYWENLDKELQQFAKEQNFDYKTNDDTFTKPFNAKPTLVNFFYHSKIKKSAQKSKDIKTKGNGDNE